MQQHISIFNFYLLSLVYIIQWLSLICDTCSIRFFLQSMCLLYVDVLNESSNPYYNYILFTHYSHSTHPIAGVNSAEGRGSTLK